MFSCTMNRPCPVEGQGPRTPSHQAPGHNKTGLSRTGGASPALADRRALAVSTLATFAAIDAVAARTEPTGGAGEGLRAQLAATEASAVRVALVVLWPTVPADRAAMVAALRAVADSEVAS